jgi:tryptophan 7-halogenase
MNPRRILIVGGGTAGWLTAAYLAKALRLPKRSHLDITVLESPDIGSVGVGEGTFPTIRSTLQFLGIDEAQFIRETSATLKQGIRFVDWAETPTGGRHQQFFHPFEAPFYAEDINLVPYWLLQDEATRPPFAQALTLQQRVAEAQRAPKRAGEAPYSAPLNYAYHFDAIKLAKLLADRARQLGVRHEQGTVTDVTLDAHGAIAHVHTAQARFEADLYIDCTGFRADLIGRALGSPLKSCRGQLFADRALACKLPDAGPDGPDIESCTVATAHEAGWLWEIGLNGSRGIGCVYASSHMSDERAAEVLRGYCRNIRQGGHEDVALRSIPFTPGYREQQWVKNCVAVGLSAGFLEPLEATGLVLIEAAVGMIAEMLPHSGPIHAPARRFNELMTLRFDNIINFLKLHYCLSRRSEPFWRDNADPATIPERLADLLEQWRLRPPGRFDFVLDTETFAFFNYQYILYGMGFHTNLSAGRADFTQVAEADKLFAKIQRFADRALVDLPSHRSLIQQINAMK